MNDNRLLLNNLVGDQRKARYEALAREGNGHYAAGRYADALAVMRTIAEDYGYTLSLCLSMGACLQALGFINAAVKSYKTALEYDDTNVQVWHNLATGLYEQGRAEYAMEALQNIQLLFEQRNRRHSPELAWSQSLGLFCCAAGNTYTAQAFEQDYLMRVAEWGKKFATYAAPEGKVMAVRRQLRPDITSGKVRVALYHAAPWSPLMQLELWAVQSYLDRDRYDVTLITAAVPAEHPGLGLLEGLELTHLQVPQEADHRDFFGRVFGKFDVIFDYCGHGPGNRLLAFAQQPAPIIINASGMPTGVDFDAMLTDPVTAGPLAGKIAEPLALLEHATLAYAEEPSETLSQPPAWSVNGVITYGWHGPLNKVTVQAVRLYAQVLAAHPESRLAFFTRYAACDTTEAYLRSLFKHLNVDETRVSLQPPDQALTSMDICLAPGGCPDAYRAAEAIQHGIPVVGLGTGLMQLDSLNYAVANATPHPVRTGQDQAHYVQAAVELGKLMDAEPHADWRPPVSQITNAGRCADPARYAEHVDRLIRRLLISRLKQQASSEAP